MGKQPIRGRHPKTSIQGTGNGLDFCNECPFLTHIKDKWVCNANDKILGDVMLTEIPVPDECGNHK